MEIINYKHLLVEYKDEILSQLSALQKMAKRVGVPEPTWELSDEYSHEFSVLVDKYGSGDDYEEEYETYIEQVFNININLEQTIKMEGGWQIVAAISHKAGVINQINPEFELPIRFVPSVDKCEHCGRSFPRVKSFVIVNDNGEFKQVGKTCMKQFLGINPISFISMFEAVSKFSNYIQNFGYAKNAGNRLNNLAYNVDELLKYTIGVVNRENGFVKAEWKEETVFSSNRRHGYSQVRNVRTNLGDATIDKVKYIMDCITLFKFKPEAFTYAESLSVEEVAVAQTKADRYRKLFEKYNTSTDKQYQDVANESHYRYSQEMEIVETKNKYNTFQTSLVDLKSYDDIITSVKTWAAELEIKTVITEDEEGTSVKYKSGFEEYKLGVKDTFSKARILQSNLKYICTGYNLFLKDQQYKIDNAERLAKQATLQYIGIIGEKSHLVLKITNLKTGHGEFGTWNLWSLEDAKGNVFKKFGNLNEKHIIERPENCTDLIGCTIEAMFEIKKHDDFNGEKQTILGRASNIVKIKTKS